MEAEQAILAALQTQPDSDRLPLDGIPITSKETPRLATPITVTKAATQSHTVQFFLEKLN
jgi:hypothetical protein